MVPLVEHFELRTMPTYVHMLEMVSLHTGDKVGFFLAQAHEVADSDGVANQESS